jgi:DNA polymerase III alpha subunit
VLRIAHEVAGFSLGEADVLRRSMSKFRSAHEMARLREQFITGAQQVSAMSTATAEQVWDLMAAFAGYGFPKAHAAGYAALAYRLAYLKTHYPAEFMTARLAVWGGYYSPRVYMSEARQLGLRVKPPHVNHSNDAFTLDPRDRVTLWMGLDQVRELTRTTMRSILTTRPFHSLDDFLIRAQPLHIEALNLIKCGALDGLGDQATLLGAVTREPWRGRHSPQLSLFTSSIDSPDARPSLQQRAAWEKEILGYHVAVHPLDLYHDRLAEANAVTSAAIAEHIDRAITLGGLRVALHHIKTAQGTLHLIDMEDQRGLYQVLWGQAALQRFRTSINQREPVLVHGRVRRDRRGRLIVVGNDLQTLR